MDVVNKRKTESTFLFLDAEKAFNRVEHTFLLEYLTVFGFGDRFRKWLNFPPQNYA